MDDEAWMWQSVFQARSYTSNKSAHVSMADRACETARGCGWRSEDCSSNEAIEGAGKRAISMLAMSVVAVVMVVVIVEALRLMSYISQ